MKLISITTLDSNGLPSISNKDLDDSRSNLDPYDKKIFDAILRDDLDFISSEVTASKLKIDDYIVDIRNEEVATPLLKLAVGGESISYKVAKYLLSFPEINVNAYGSNGENTLLSLCALPYGYWLPAHLSSFSRKEIATLLTKHKKIDMDVVKYDFNFDSNNYEKTDQTPLKAAKEKSNVFMIELISKDLTEEVKPEESEVRSQFIQFHQQIKQMLNQPFPINTNATTTQNKVQIPEMEAFEAAIKEAKEMARSFQTLKLS